MTFCYICIMVYRFKATIPESKIFYRVYEIKGETTLFKLNSFLMEDLGFSPDQIVLFDTFSPAGEPVARYGLFDLGDGSMDKVTVGDLAAADLGPVHYLFDLRNDRFIILSLEGEVEQMSYMTYPAMVEEKGQAPDQFTFRFEEPEPEHQRKPSLSDPDDDDFDDEDEDDEDDDDEEEDGDEDGKEIFDESEM